MKVSQTDVNVMKSLYNNGVKVSLIANAFKVDPATVRYHVNPVYKTNKQGAYIRKIAMYNEDKDVVRLVSDYLNSVR